MTLLSGTQVRLSSSGYVADISSVGASLRTLSFEGRDLVSPFGEDEVRPNYFGAILVPWPNRVVGGRYSYEGQSFQLALTEPDRGHALHGLAVWLDFAVAEQSEDRVVLTANVAAETSYPFPLSVAVEYRLDGDGLTTLVTTTNNGSVAAPYGVGPHPYLLGGEGVVDEWTLEVPASQVLEVDAVLAPTELIEVTEKFDFRSPKLVGDVEIDNAYTGVSRGADGRAAVRVTGADGHGAELSWGEGLDWVQIFTGDLPDPVWRRRAIAVEPMTCAPDAFNTGTGLILIAPGEAHSAEWVISAL
ncbi:aldose 1-epimerase family protein [Amnibacterium flavum]|uniref:aldose 1-epimerase family protein n=1 Tax=Amnibacterium flavum TaxID=2173173 RepID=UPI00268F53FE